MSKKVLVTGATGLLGSTLVPFLKEKQYQVVAQGNSNGGDIQFDLTNREETLRQLDIIKPDLIVHLVALTNVDLCEEEPQKAHALNCGVLENIVSWIKSNDQCQLINISTDQIYDGEGPFSEVQTKPSNYYGFSKYCGELITNTVDGVNLRTNFFGKSRCHHRKSFSDWLIESFNNQEKITLFTDVFFSPLSLTTLCEMIATISEKPIPGTYNLGSKEGKSKRDFAYELADLLNLDTSSSVDSVSKNKNLKAYRPQDMRLVTDLFEQTYQVELNTLKNEIKKEYGEQQ